MLSIDEAIAREREMAEMHRNDIVPKENYHNMPWVDKNNEASMRSAEECEQLAEWLEELKAYREVGTVEECRNSVLDIPKAYNKAIDDFKQKLLKKAPRNYAGELELGGSVCFLSANSVTKIAEQLKVGGKMYEFGGWGSPVNIISSQMNMQMEGEILKAIRNVGIIVDKEELIKALNYDIGQYSKGFENGYNKAIDDFMKFANTMPTVEEEDGAIRPMRLEEMAEQLKVGV